MNGGIPPLREKEEASCRQLGEVVRRLPVTSATTQAASVSPLHQPPQTAVLATISKSLLLLERDFLLPQTYHKQCLSSVT
ncbi:MAG: hypothetical protein ICV63_13445 [Coleofasciculus sp. Co-bin14]|nr:hypothetical protein [Coleofasciculus sp. Co-bin14]